MADVILTGLPRAGLTAVAALIDYLPDCVCLNDPPWQLLQAGKPWEVRPYAKWLAGDFIWQRARLLHQNPIRDHRAADGTPLLDGLYDPKRIAGERPTVAFTRPGLSEDFILAMKSHALYTALLPELIDFDHFTIIAIIRHPLDVITSWQRCEGHPVAEGRIDRHVEQFWPEAARISNSQAAPLERMVQLYDLFCECYWELHDRIHVVKYEDVVADPTIVSRVLGHDALSAAAPMLKNPPRMRMAEEADAIRHQLRYSVFARQLYMLE